MAKANLKKVAAAFAALAMMGTAIPANVFSTDYLATVSAASTPSAADELLTLKAMDNLEEILADAQEGVNSAMIKNDAYQNVYKASVYNIDDSKYKEVYLKKDTDGNIIAGTNSHQSAGFTVSGIANRDGSVVAKVTKSDDIAVTLNTYNNPAENSYDRVVVIDGASYYYKSTDATKRLYKVNTAYNASGSGNALEKMIPIRKFAETPEILNGIVTSGEGVTPVVYNQVQAEKLVLGKGISTRDCNYQIIGDKVKVTYKAIDRVETEEKLAKTIYIDGKLETDKCYVTKTPVDYEGSKCVIISKDSADANTAKWYEVDVDGKYYSISDPDIYRAVETAIGSVASSNKEVVEVQTNDKFFTEEPATEFKPGTKVYGKTGVINTFTKITKDAAQYTDASDSSLSGVAKNVNVYAKVDGSNNPTEVFTDEACTEFVPFEVLIVDADGNTVGKRVYSRKDQRTEQAVDKKTVEYTDIYEGAATLLGVEALYSNKVTYRLGGVPYTHYTSDGTTNVEIQGRTGRTYTAYTLYEDMECTKSSGHTLYHDVTTGGAALSNPESYFLYGSVIEKTFRNEVAGGKNIKLSADVELTETPLVVNYNAVIDLNGHKITADDASIQIANGKTLTIFDSKTTRTESAKIEAPIELVGATSTLKIVDTAASNKVTVDKVIPVAVDGNLSGSIVNNGGTVSVVDVTVTNISNWKDALSKLSDKVDAVVTVGTVGTLDCHIETTEQISHDVWLKAGTVAGPANVNKYGFTINPADGTVLGFAFDSDTKKVKVTNADATAALRGAATYTDLASHDATAVEFAAGFTKPANVGTEKYDVTFASVAHEGFEYKINSKTHTISCTCTVAGDGIKAPHNFHVLGTVGSNVIAECDDCGYVTSVKKATAEAISSSLAKTDSATAPYAQKFSFAIAGGKGQTISSYGVIYNKDGSDIDTDKVTVNESGRIETDYLYTSKTVIKTNGVYSISVGTADAKTAVKVIPYVVVDGVAQFGDAVGTTFEKAAQAEAEANCTSAVSKVEKASDTSVKVTFELSAGNGYVIKSYQATGNKLPGAEPFIAPLKSKIKTNGEYDLTILKATSAEVKVAMTVTDPYGLDHEIIPAELVKVTAK